MATKSLVQILFSSGNKLEAWYTQFEAASEDGVVTSLTYTTEDGSKPHMFLHLASIESIYIKQTVEYFDGAL